MCIRDSFHTDFGKPYRCAENLRFWIKAAELRWEVKLDVNALDVANGKDRETWKRFDQAILTWCSAVRSELTAELLPGSEPTTPAKVQLPVRSDSRMDAAKDEAVMLGTLHLDDRTDSRLDVARGEINV